MGEAQVLECSFYVPIRRDKELSDGELHGPAAWHWLLEELYKLSEGETAKLDCLRVLIIADGLHRGSYKDPQRGERIFDDSREYTVGLPEQEVDCLRRLLAQCCWTFEQKCILTTHVYWFEYIISLFNFHGTI